MSYKKPWEREQVVKRVQNFDSFQPPKADIWATYIPERSPMWKVAASESEARKATTYEDRPYMLYQLVENAWVKVDEQRHWTSWRTGSAKITV